MKLPKVNIPFASLTKFKLQTVRNLESIVQLKFGENLKDLDSVKYASTIITQSGHTITDMRLKYQKDATMPTPVGVLMEEWGTPPEAWNKLLGKYGKEGLNPTAMVLSGFDVEFDLVPYHKAP